MASVCDIAAYVLQKQGRMTAMQLQKLVYYSQVWSIVWDGVPLFQEPIEAWVDGPVVRELYDKHRGRRRIEPGDLRPKSEISDRQHQTIAAVIGFYGRRDAEWLSELSHREAPWANARAGRPGHARGAEVIDEAAIRDYYGKAPRVPGVKAFSAEYERGVELIVNMSPDEVESLFTAADASGDEVAHWLRTGEGPAPCEQSF